MMLFVTTLHIILCTILILVILLQPGKGGDVAAAFGGGGSSTMFGPRGPASLLTRATTVVAVLFMATSITLAMHSDRAHQANTGGLEDDIERLQQEEEAERAKEQEEQNRLTIPTFEDDALPLEIPIPEDPPADAPAPPEGE